MVTTKPFGTCEAGEVTAITIQDGKFQAEILTYGGILRTLIVPDCSGNPVDVVLGYDTLADYLKDDVYFGSTVGRHANRLADASFTLNGVTYPLTANEGSNQLHGGFIGFNQKLWDYTTTDCSVTLTRTSPDGEEGYPGNLQVAVTYTLQNGGLTIDFRATTDADTVVNLTNHSYFNLAGHNSGRVDDQVLTLQADAMTPCKEGNIPTGEIVPVAGTLFDLTQPTRLGDRMTHPDLASSRGYDHNFVLNGAQPFATAHCDQTGIQMTASTTLPGVQVYTAGWVTPRIAKDGAHYDGGHAFCLETQFYPDAIHQPHFPSPILKKGDTYCQSTTYQFSII